VYFCCLECLQNAAKQAGPGASATIRLAETDDHVSFDVEDDGAGFDPDAIERGAGLTNLVDRMAAVGGTLQIDARPGRGTRLTGEPRSELGDPQLASAAQRKPTFPVDESGLLPCRAATR
jgi:signal transduction histidine kinase